MRHYLVNWKLLDREEKFVVFRETVGIPWVREAVLAGPIHSHSIRHSEVVALTADAAGNPCRVFYLRHDLGDLDGIGVFRPDEMQSVPARADKLAIKLESECPSFDFVPSDEVVQREMANHSAQVEAWRRLDPEFKKQPAGFLRRVLGWT